MVGESNNRSGPTRELRPAFNGRRARRDVTQRGVPRQSNSDSTTEEERGGFNRLREKDLQIVTRMRRATINTLMGRRRQGKKRYKKKNAAVCGTRKIGCRR